MVRKEQFFFAVDALVKVATEDPACIPLRLFFDRQAHVLTTRQCYESAFETYSQSHLVERKAMATFSTYFEKVQILEVDEDATNVGKYVQTYAVDEAGASLMAAIQGKESNDRSNESVFYLVTNDHALMEAARSENIDFHDYTEQEFCAKYGS